MKKQENLHIVKSLYAAVGEGDLPTALDALADDVEWQSPVTRTKHVEISWARPRKGRKQVMQFFKELAEKMELEPFELLGFTVQGDKVVVEGRNKGTVKATKRTYEHDWVMVFTLREGKIVRCWHYYDTADILGAFQSKQASQETSL